MAENCPECKNEKLTHDYQKGEVVCSNCGLVVAEGIEDHGPERTAFDMNQKDGRSRSGAPITPMRSNKGLPTEIDSYNRDSKGNKISSKKLQQLGRMRKWHKRMSYNNGEERNLSIALSELDRIGSYLGLANPVREDAALLYRKCLKKELSRRRRIEEMVAAVVYATCRIRGIPRTLDEIAAVSGMDKKEVGRAFRMVHMELQIEVPLAHPGQYVPKMVSALKLSGTVQEKAIALLNKITRLRLLSGHAPTGIAAGAVYVAATIYGERRTQKDVADVAGVTEVTIRNHYRRIKRQLKLKIEDGWKI